MDSDLIPCTISYFLPAKKRKSLLPNYSYEPRPIRLADVLLAVKINDGDTLLRDCAPLESPWRRFRKPA